MRVRSDIAVALRVLNSARFSANMHNAARSIQEFRNEMGTATTYQGRFNAAGKAGQAILYGMGAASNAAMVGLGAAAAATIGFGIQFNATMESNSLAFSKFVGKGKPSLAFTKELFSIASKTPFSFEDITTAGRRLLAFGFNARETTGLLKTMGDTISYTGGSTDEILRLGKALGDIRAKGKLMQQEMNQLANVGIPIRDILAKGGLELTEKQLYNIGRAGIPAADAINAIQQGLNLTYGGGAVEYLKTFNGQWQRLQDNLKATAGAATQGLFGSLKGQLTAMNDTMDSKKGFFNGGTWKKIEKSIGGFFKGAIGVGKTMVGDLFNALKPMQPFLANVIVPLLKGVFMGVIPGLVIAWKIFVGTIWLLSTALGFLGKILKPFGSLLTAIGFIIGFVFGGSILKVLGALSKFGGVFRIVGGTAKVAGGLLWVVGRILGGLVAGVIRLGAIVGTRFPALAQAAWHVLSPFLRIKATMRTAYIAIVNFAARAPGVLGKLFLNMGLKLGDFIFHGMWSRLVRVFTGAGAFIAGMGGSLRNWFNEHTLFGNTIDLKFAKIKIPKLGMGGTILPGGSALVGERGQPEVAHHTSRGTFITPMRGKMPSSQPSNATPGKVMSGAKMNVNIPVYLNHREVGRAFGEIIEDRLASA